AGSPARRAGAGHHRAAGVRRGANDRRHEAGAAVVHAGPGRAGRGHRTRRPQGRRVDSRQTRSPRPRRPFRPAPPVAPGAPMTAAPPVTSAATPSAAAPRLRVVGIGCDGWAGLPERSRGVLASAERIVGAPRQLALLADDPAAASALTAAFEQWPEKYWTRWGEVLGALDPAADVVLASGDPMFHGIGATLVRELGAEAIEVFPAPSSAALACAHMGWALNETPVVTLVTGPAGREGTGAVVAAADRGIPFLVLCRSAESVGHVADALRESIVRRFAVVDDGAANGTGAGSGTGAGNGAPQGSVAHVAELLDATVLTAMTNLGGPADGAYAEDVRRGTVGKPPTAAGDLTVLAVEPAAPARAWLTDGDFETDGQLTKSPFREMTVA